MGHKFRPTGIDPLEAGSEMIALTHGTDLLGDLLTLCRIVSD
jgi:hypothetical protein